MSQARQRIRFLRTGDGVKLAWAEAGSGPLLVKAANWMTHLEFEWESPVWRHWLRFLSDHFRFVRYDERGCGLTDWEVPELSMDRWVSDLENVIDAADPQEPFTLLGISQGAAACIGYAVQHPERVARMVLYGAYARGVFHRGYSPRAVEENRVMREAVRIGWGNANPSFRQLFTSRFIPGGTLEQVAWFNDLCRRTTTGEIAAELLRMRANLDVSSLLGRVQCPTLVIHGRDDEVIPVAEGRLLASAIPDAQFVELDSRNHVLLEDEPAWPRFQEAVLEFCEGRAVDRDDPFGSLSPREREILALITEGLGNAEIGERLDIREKTVRNHISSVYDKLGVWTRAQAMVFARDHGFRG